MKKPRKTTKPKSFRINHDMIFKEGVGVLWHTKGESARFCAVAASIKDIQRMCSIILNAERAGLIKKTRGEGLWFSSRLLDSHRPLDLLTPN